MECQRKGSLITPSKMPPNNGKIALQILLYERRGKKKKKTSLTYAHTHSDKGKVINAHPHMASHVLHGNANKDDCLSGSATSTLMHAVNVAPTINMLDLIKV